jgi:hypothetical protein
LGARTVGGVCRRLETQNRAEKVEWTWVFVAGYMIGFEDVTAAAEREVEVGGLRMLFWFLCMAARSLSKLVDKVFC